MFNLDNAFEEGPPVKFALRLGSIKSTRQTMSRLIRERAKGNVADGDFKSIIYGLAQLQSYWRLELDTEIESRLEALEARLS